MNVAIHIEPEQYPDIRSCVEHIIMHSSLSHCFVIYARCIGTADVRWKDKDRQKEPRHAAERQWLAQLQ